MKTVYLKLLKISYPRQNTKALWVDFIVSKYLKLGHANEFPGIKLGRVVSEWSPATTCQWHILSLVTVLTPSGMVFPPMGSISNAIGDHHPLPSKAGRCIPRGLTRQQHTLTVKSVGIECHMLNLEQTWRFSFPLLTRNSLCISNRHFSYCLPKGGWWGPMGTFFL